MRNLKKVLALTLVLALSLSMVISAGAAKFSDVSDTDANAAAYALLADLKIAQGYDDGTFQPDTNLTRETAVTFIFRMATGQANADYMKGTTQFKDVAADRWSAGYINWASEKNIVQGDPDGNFAPARTVSVAELSKMMVVAMGYDVKNYNFPWGFVDKAQDLGLLNGLLNQSANTPATRGMTSIVIRNGLLNDGRVEIIGDNVTKLKSFAESRFNIVKSTEEVRVLGTSNLVNAQTVTAISQVALKIGAAASADVFTYAGNVDSLFGRQVTVWYKNDGSVDASNKPTFDDNDTVVSITAKGGDKVLTANAKDADTTADTIKVDGVTYNVDLEALNSYDFGASDKTSINNASVLTLIVEGSTVKYAYATTANLYQVTAISAKNAVTLKGVKVNDAALDSTKVSTYADGYYTSTEALAKDAYVYVAPSKAYVAADKKVGTVASLTPAKIVANSYVSAITADKATYTIDGVGYKLFSGMTAPALGAKDNFFISSNGLLYAAKAVAATTTSQYAVILGATETFGVKGTYVDRKISVIKSDGTSAVLDVVDSATDVDLGNYTANTKWNISAGTRPAVELTLNSDGKVTKIAALSATSAGSTLEYDTSTSFAKVASSGQYTVSADTVIFVVEPSKAVKVYKGAAIPSFAAGTPKLVNFVTDGTGLNTIKVAVLDKDITASNESKNGFIVLKDAKMVDGNKVYVYDVFRNGELVERTASSDIANVTNAPLYGAIELNSDGTVAKFTPANLTYRGYEVTGRSGSVVILKQIATGNDTGMLTIDGKVAIVETKADGTYKTITGPGALSDVAKGAVIDYEITSGKISFIVVRTGAEVEEIAAPTKAANDSDISDAKAELTTKLTGAALNVPVATTNLVDFIKTKVTIAELKGTTVSIKAAVTTGTDHTTTVVTVATDNGKIGTPKVGDIVTVTIAINKGIGTEQVMTDMAFEIVA